MSLLPRFAVMAVGGLVLAGALTADLRAAPPGYAAVVSVGPRPNPYFFVRPGLTLQQYAYNVSVLGRAYSRVPPYALGYNPYPPPVYYPGNIYGTVTPYYNPYAAYGAGLYYPNYYGLYLNPYYSP